MLTDYEADTLVGKLSLMPFAPAEPAARLALAEMFQDMIDTYAHGQQLVKRIINSPRYEKFPAPAEIRGVYCSMFPPQDGINGYSQVYPHGDFPDAKPLVAPPLKRLPAGHAATADPELDGGFQKLLAAPMGMPDPQTVRLSPEERRREAEFSRTLDAALDPPGDRNQPEDDKLLQVELETRRKKRQSELVCLHPEDEFGYRPRPAGSFRPITQADVDRLVSQRSDSKGAA